MSETNKISVTPCPIAPEKQAEIIERILEQHAEIIRLNRVIGAAICCPSFVVNADTPEGADR